MLLRDYVNSFNFYRNGELPRNQIGRSGVQVYIGNEKFTVVSSRSPQNLEMRVFFLIKPIVLRRCRCLRRCLIDQKPRQNTNFSATSSIILRCFQLEDNISTHLTYHVFVPIFSKNLSITKHVVYGKPYQVSAL